MVKPFLLLSIRADDAAADNEYEAFLRFSGLGAGELRRVRLDQRALEGSTCGTGPGSCSAAGRSTTPSRTS